MLPDKRTRLLLIFASIALWLVSMVLPAVQFHENPGPNMQVITHDGFTMLFYSALFGWWMYANFAFLANPLLLFGWIFIGQQRYRRAIFWIAPAALLTLQTFQVKAITWHEDEGGVNNSLMTHPTIGWYVWVASILLPLAAAIHWRRIQKALPPAPAV
jgi:hypothetical protein